MRRLIACLTSALFFACAATASPIPFTGHIGFGDSFSDKGRFGRLQPPSNAGRFTDGITWMEILSNAFSERGQANFNMAMGGATAGPVNTNDLGYLLAELLVTRDPNDPDDIPFFSLGNLSRQISSAVNAGFDTLLGDNPLVTIQLGGNDFQQNPDANPLDVIGAIVSGIEEIVALGAQFDNFMIGNLPDFSILPEFFDAPDEEREAIRDQSVQYNLLLSQAMADLATAQDIEIEIFDFFGVTDSIYQEAIDAGLVLDEPCTDTLLAFFPNPGNNCFFPGASEDFLFVDDVHPGDFVHSRWGAAALAQIDNRLAPIPLPASMPLLFAGAGLFAVAARRRRPV